MKRLITTAILSMAVTAASASSVLAVHPTGSDGHGAAVSALAHTVKTLEGRARGEAISALAKAHGAAVSAAAKANGAAKSAAGKAKGAAASGAAASETGRLKAAAGKAHKP